MIRLIGVVGKVFVLDLASDMEGTISITGGISKDVDENICTLEELKYIETSFKTKRVSMSSGDYTKLLAALEDKQSGGGTASYPSFIGNADKVLTVNATEDDVEWKTAVTQVYVDTQDSLLQDQINSKADAMATSQSLALKADLISGLIPASQLPSYVDDVLNFPDLASFPSLGEDGKIYIAEDVNKTYRWGGSSYVEIGGGGVALGETSSTAYRGDNGKIAYDHSLSQGNPHNTTTSEINEGAKLFFTEPRVRNTVLTGLVTNNSTNVTNTDTVEVAIGKLEAKSQGSSSMPLWVNLRTLDSFFIATSVPNQTINCNIEFQKRNGNVYMRGYFGTNGNLTNTSTLFFHRADSYYCEKSFSNIMGEGSNITKLTNIPIYGTNSSGVMLTGLLQIEQGSAAIAAYNFSGRNLEQNIVWHIPEVCLGKSFI